MKTNYKIFLAGLAPLGSILPFVYTFLYAFDLSSVRTLSLQFIPLYLPIIFGVWNVLYFHTLRKWFPRNQNRRLWIAGIILGFILGLVEVYVVKLPERALGMTGVMVYIPIFIAPVFFGALWRYVVKWFNAFFEIKD